jgi:hypothetical protein
MLRNIKHEKVKNGQKLLSTAKILKVYFSVILSSSKEVSKEGCNKVT